MSAREAEIGRVERLVALRSFPGWVDLPTGDLATLAEVATPRWFETGARLLEEGQPVSRIYLVVRGELALRRGGVEIGRYGPHTGVGALAAFARDARGYECAALTDTLVLEMHADDLTELFEDRFLVLLRVLQEMARESIRIRRGLRPSAGFPRTADPGERCPMRRLDLVERIFFLRQNLAFASGFIDSIAALARSADEVRLPSGQVLWRPGDRADAMIALVCGTVRARTPEGLEFAFGAGDLVGGLDSTAREPRWFEAVVEDGMVGLTLQRDATVDVWEDHPDLGMEVLRGFSAGLLSLLEQKARPATRRLWSAATAATKEGS